jgi:hypothetical protein
MTWQTIMQISVIILVWSYLAMGPYATIYEQAVGQLKGPLEIAWRSVKNAFTDIYLLATNPTEWYARQQVINARPEKPISFPKALEVGALDITPPSVPGGQPFVLNFVLKNEGDSAAEWIRVSMGCNQWCKVPPSPDLLTRRFSLCREIRSPLGDHFYCAENCGGDMTESGSPMLIDDCVKSCIDQGKTTKEIIWSQSGTGNPWKSTVSNKCVTKDRQAFEKIYWPQSPQDTPVLEKGESEIVTIEPFSTFQFQGGKAETKIAKLSVNVSFDYSTASQLLVSILGKEEEKRLVRENRLDFKPVVATAKVSPAKLSINVGPQPLKAGTEATLLISVSNDRDKSSILLYDGTEIVITVPTDIGNNLHCLGSTPGSSLIDADGNVVTDPRQAFAERLVYEVQAPKGYLEILPYEFNSIYTFICKFDTKAGVDTVKTGIITANLTTYTFVHTLTKDIPVTAPLGVLFDPYESYCNGVSSRDMCHERSASDPRHLGVCYYDAVNGPLSQIIGTTCHSCGDKSTCDKFLTEDACVGKDGKGGEALSQCQIRCVWNKVKDTYIHSIKLEGKCEPPSPSSAKGISAESPVVGVPEGMTAEILSTYLQQNAQGPLAEQATAFFELGQQYNVDPSFAIAVAMHETGKGASEDASSKNNYFGMLTAGEGSPKIQFAIPRAGIEEFYKKISNIYIGQYQQDTIDKISCAPSTAIEGHCYVGKAGDEEQRSIWRNKVKLFRQQILNMLPSKKAFEGSMSMSQFGVPADVIAKAEDNYLPRNADVQYIVLHHTAGPSALSALTTWAGNGNSAHYIVEKDGRIISVIPEDLSAQHANCMNSKSIGIEIVNLGDGSDSYPPGQVNSVRILVSYLIQKYNIPSGNLIGHGCTSNQKQEDEPTGLPQDFMGDGTMLYKMKSDILNGPICDFLC